MKDISIDVLKDVCSEEFAQDFINHMKNSVQQDENINPEFKEDLMKWLEKSIADGIEIICRDKSLTLEQRKKYIEKILYESLDMFCHPDKRLYVGPYDTNTNNTFGYKTIHVMDTEEDEVVKGYVIPTIKNFGKLMQTVYDNEENKHFWDSV